MQDINDVIVIIDACYSGDLNEIRKMSLEYSSNRLKTGFHSLTGFFKTYDGLIGKYLIEALSGNANSVSAFGNGDTYISFYEAATYTAQKVMKEYTEEHDELLNVRFMLVATEPLNLLKIGVQ